MWVHGYLSDTRTRCLVIFAYFSLTKVNNVNK